MTKSNRLLLLLSIYTALLAASCGIEYKIGFFVVASAATTTASVNPKLATCGAGSDQPQCDDPAYNESDKDGSGQDEAVPSRQQQKDAVDNRQRAATKQTPPNNLSTRESTAKERQAYWEGIRPKFQPGDIIELYNTESRDIQIVFPSIVKGRDPTDPLGGYRVTKTTDGKEVKNLPEKFLHPYVPYKKGDEALCNIGEFRANRPIIVRCTVLSYESAATRGAMVLQGNYEVQVHATKANEEYETNLPVWKLQRRYLATAKVTATA